MLLFKLGLDVVDTVFKTCDKDGEEGLRIEELKDSACMDTLHTLFDEIETELIGDFNTADANEDTIVTKKEVIDAFCLFKPLIHYEALQNMRNMADPLAGKFYCRYVTIISLNYVWVFFQSGLDGVHPVDTIFNFCDKDGEDGLKIEEVKNSVCMEALGLLLGETEESVERHFKMGDLDKDNIVTKVEANIALQKLQLNRGLFLNSSPEYDTPTTTTTTTPP